MENLMIKKYLFVLMIVFGFASSIVTADDQAPQFALNDLAGNLVQSSDFIGKQPTILVFWASW